MERGPHRNWEVNDERNICREYSSLPSNWNHSHELAVSHTLVPLIFSLLLCAKFLLRGEEIHKILIENIYDSEHTGVDRISRVLSNRSNFEQSYTRINWILSNRSNSKQSYTKLNGILNECNIKFRTIDRISSNQTANDRVQKSIKFLTIYESNSEQSSSSQSNLHAERSIDYCLKFPNSESIG